MTGDAFPRIEPEDFPKVPLVLDSVSSRFIKENKIIPIELKGGVLKVIMSSPFDLDVIEALKVAADAQVVACDADQSAIDEYVSRFYAQESQTIDRIIEDMDGNNIEFIREEEEDVGHLKDLASEAPIIKALQSPYYEGRGEQGKRYPHRALR